jgi:2-polyprenyl-3-methyl-5-hydroxy-6-metoxy-1,4-benzoquinol methylase
MKTRRCGSSPRSSRPGCKVKDTMNAVPKYTDDFPCLLCGDPAYKVLHENSPFKSVRCAGCGLVYIRPRLHSEAILDLYNDSYWQSDRAKDYGYTDYLADAPLYLSTYRIRSRVIDAYKPTPGKVLDVGCAAGFFLKVMHDKGWETLGVEVSPPMVEFAKKDLTLPEVRLGDTAVLHDLPDKHFDLITFWDVVEHLEDPIAHLAAVRRLLKDDGILIIETQNVESTFAYLLGKHWQHYKYEEHLYHFSPITLRTLLSRAGFHIVENTPRYGGKKVSLHFIIERVGKIHPIFTKLLSPLRALGHWNFYLNVYDEMIAVARKTGFT